MGNTCTTAMKQLLGSESFVIATLNYGGIINSPFEFFSNDQQEQIKISEKFKTLIQTYFKDYDPKTFTWNIGKIDKNIQKQRYTSIYNPTVGVQNNRLVSVEEFKNLWDKNFIQAEKNVKMDKLSTEQEKQTMKKFDLICYHALICHAYKVKEISEVQKGKRSSAEYLKLTKKFFDRSYLDQTKKIKKLQNLFDKQTIHVYFIQEPSQQLINRLDFLKNTFHIQAGQSDTSLIMIRKKNFVKIERFDQVKKFFKFTSEQESKIKQNKETRVLFCDRIIFVCVHLSSKAQKNKIQLKELKQIISILMNKCPGYNIVVGGDMNTFVKKQQVIQQKELNNVDVFPDDQKLITTSKKRTYMQPQFNKANKTSAEVKDQIITTLQISDKHIWTIDCRSVTDEVNLPAQEHPFDHFLVACQLKR